MSEPLQHRLRLQMFAEDLGLITWCGQRVRKLECLEARQAWQVEAALVGGVAPEVRFHLWDEVTCPECLEAREAERVAAALQCMSREVSGD